MLQFAQRVQTSCAAAVSGMSKARKRAREELYTHIGDTQPHQPGHAAQLQPEHLQLERQQDKLQKQRRKRQQKRKRKQMQKDKQEAVTTGWSDLSHELLFRIAEQLNAETSRTAAPHWTAARSSAGSGYLMPVCRRWADAMRKSGV